MARNTSSSLETLDTLFASDSLHEQESPIVTGRSSVASRARQTFSTIEPLEERIVQTVDPVMGPLQSPEMVRTPEEQQELNSLNDQVQAARMELSELDPTLEEATQTLHDANTTLGADHALVITQTSLLNSALASRTLAEQHLLDATTANTTAQSNLQLGLDRLNRDIQRMQVAKAALDKANAALASAGTKIGRMLAQAVVNECNNEYKNRQAYVNDDNTTHLPPLRAAATSSQSALEKAKSDRIKAEADVTLTQNALDLATAKEQADTLTRNAAQDAFTLVHNQRADVQKRLDDLLQELADLDAFFTEQHRQHVDSTVEPDNTELAAALALSVQSALEEEANQIAYAKMFVSIEDLPTTDTRLHIHFRNPGQQTLLKLRMEGNNRNDVIAIEPTADGYASITFRPGDGYSGGFVLQLADGETGQIIQEVHGSYDRYGKSARIDTQQLSFDTEETGMLSENPITPSISVGKIQGATLLVVAQTPHDQYIVTSDMSGLLSSDPESSPGGTSFGLSQITVNTSRPTGDYQIFLLESQGGRILDTIPFHFDHNSRAITLLNGSDMYEGSVDETDTAQQLQAMQALNNVPLGLANLEIATTQRLRLYQNTADLAAPYNIYVTAQAMLDKLYAAPFFAQFAPQNQEVEVQKFMEAGGTYTSHGVTGYNMSYTQAQDSIMRGRQQRVKDYNTYLGTYETAMSECMQAAVNIFLAITKGDPEDTVRSTFDETWNRWSTNGALNPLQAIGITFPNRDRFIGAAKMLFQKEWRDLVTAQEDVVQVREREEFWLSKGMYEKANGEWAMATNEHTPIQPPKSMSPEQIRLAAKIMGVIASSTDPRIRALSAVRQQQAALQIGAITATDPAEAARQQARVLAGIAQASAADAYVAAHQSEVNSAVQSVGQQYNLSSTDSSNVFKWVQQDPELLSSAGFDGATENSLLSAVQNLIGGLFSIPRASAAEFDESRTVTNFEVRKDTPVGQMFLAILQKTEGTNDVSIFAGYAKVLQDRTNIPWYKTAAALEVSGQSARASNLKALFTLAGYGDIFTISTASSNAQVLSVAPNKTEYAAGETVQVRFDVAIPNGYVIDHAFAYAMYNGQQLSISEPVSAEITNQMFAQIPVGKIQSQILFSHNGPVSVQIKIAVWLKRNDGLSSQMITTGGISQTITVPENSISLTQEEMSVIDMNIPSQFVNNQKLIQSMIQNYFLGTDPNNKLEKVGNGWQAAIHGTGDKQCKPWLDEIFVLHATGINIPKTATDQSSWIIDQNSPVQQIAKINKSEFQSTIENGGIIAGDLVQMTGDFDNNPKTVISPHTMLIGKIQSDGIWVLDTNFGNEGEWMDDDNYHQGLLTGIVDNDGIRRELTTEEKANNVPGTLWYQDDNTIRYHFMSYTDLTKEVTSASIYRLN